MALINLKTSLTSLKFGNDTQGGGNSGLPYVQFGIPGVSATRQQEAFYKANSNSIDNIVRGGVQASNMARSFDYDRILAFYKDNKRGPFFIQKQIELQLKNPKIETGNVLTNTPGLLNVPTLLENTRLYNNGENTLAQVLVQGTGEHIIRHGQYPFGARQPYYADIVNLQNITNQSETNRLLLLTKLKMKTDQGFVNNTANTIGGIVNNIRTGNTQSLLSSAVDFALAKKLGVSLNRNLLFNYPQGPGSIFGGTDTIIPRVSDTTRVVTGTGMVYDQLRQQYATKDGPVFIQDYRKQLSAFSGSNLTWDYNNTLIGNSSLKNQNLGPTVNGVPIDYTVYVSKDKINSLYPKLNNSTEDPFIEDKDIIKFGFECISNDNPDYSTSLLFRAFLTAGLSDSNTAQLNSFKYMGRGENFYTYQGFDRSISFSFRIAALSRDELMPLHRKLEYLKSQVYPDYSPNLGIMRAPLVKVTIGDYLYRMPGFLESVNILIDNSYSWEINLENSDEIGQLPHIVDVSISFKPIFDTLPKRQDLYIDQQNFIRQQINSLPATSENFSVQNNTIV